MFQMCDAVIYCFSKHCFNAATYVDHVSSFQGLHLISSSRLYQLILSLSLCRLMNRRTILRSGTPSVNKIFYCIFLRKLLKIIYNASKKYILESVWPTWEFLCYNYTKNAYSTSVSSFHLKFLQGTFYNKLPCHETLDVTVQCCLRNLLG